MRPGGEYETEAPVRRTLLDYLDRNAPETTHKALADLLRRWAQDGASAPEIAAVLGAPLPTVCRFAQRHGIRLADGRRRRTWRHPTHIGRPMRSDRAVPLCGAPAPSHSWIASSELAATCAECRRSWHAYLRHTDGLMPVARKAGAERR